MCMEKVAGEQDLYMFVLLIFILIAWNRYIFGNIFFFMCLAMLLGFFRHSEEFGYLSIKVGDRHLSLYTSTCKKKL